MMEMDSEARGRGHDEQGQDTGRHISVGGDEVVARLTLAARWAERYDASPNDSLHDVLMRFRRAYGFVDDVTKSIITTEE